MNQFITASILLLLFIPGAGLTGSSPLNSASDLMAGKQYLSAFRVLHEADKENTNPDIFIIKAEIALFCYVKTFMHQSFAFADLKENEIIEDLRAGTGVWPVFDFQINRILDSMLTAYPKDKRLRKLQGDYYYEVYRVFGPRWLLPGEDILKRSETGYSEAEDFSVRTLNNMGLMRALRGDKTGAEKYFSLSSEKHPGDPEGYYNLAYLFFSSNRNSEALTLAEKAYYLYTDPPLKGDAAYLAAALCDRLGRKKEAVHYASEANLNRKNSLIYLRGELTLLIKYRMFNEAESAAYRLTETAPEELSLYHEISSVYGAAANRKQAAACFDYIEKKYSANEAAAGNAIYARALFLKHHNNDSSGYKTELKRSLEKYKTAYPPDHEVIKKITLEIERAR